MSAFSLGISIFYLTINVNKTFAFITILMYPMFRYPIKNIWTESKYI